MICRSVGDPLQYKATLSCSCLQLHTDFVTASLCLAHCKCPDELAGAEFGQKLVLSLFCGVEDDLVETKVGVGDIAVRL